MTFKKLILLLLSIFFSRTITADITIPTPQFTPTSRLKGYLQFDAGMFGFKEDDFGFRRVRTDFVGSLTKEIDYRVNLEHSNSRSQLLDSTITLKLSKENSIIFGKTKGFIGLEFLQTASNLALPEFGLSTYLVPNRDIGIQFVRKTNHADYRFGIFSGASDFENLAIERDRSRSISGRAFLYPIRNNSTLLGLGIAGNFENRQGTISNSGLATYDYRGYGPFYSYSSDTYANGRGYRLAPQGYFYKNRFGLLAEYVISSQEISNGEDNAKVDNQGWQIALQYMLSNDKATYGEVIPTSPFEENKGRGAWQLGFRIGEIKFDKKAFPIFATSDQTLSMTQIGASINWIWNKTLKWTAGIESLHKTDYAENTTPTILALLRTQITF